MVLLVLFLSSTLSMAAAIAPGGAWTDTKGARIQAHGGGFLRQGGFYYWFGEDKTANRNLFSSVNVYRSTDLEKWEHLGQALKATPNTEISGINVVERPKVIYNERTKQYVMWFHLDSAHYQLAKLGVATSSTVLGPYKFVRSIRPFNEESRDMTVWVDESDPKKTAYVIYATRVNMDTVIATLTPDYQNVDKSLVTMKGVHREGYAVFKRNGLYYLITSGATGWDPNENTYMTSRRMGSGWSAQKPLAPGSKNTYQSQATYVIPLANGGFVYAGDRWSKGSLGDSRYVWLPIKFDAGGKIHIDWADNWSISGSPAGKPAAKPAATNPQNKKH